MTERKPRPPGVRIDGSKRTDLKKRRERNAAVKQARPPAEPIEDDRVSRAWDREERRQKSAEKARQEAKAIKAEKARPRREERSMVVDNPYFSTDHPENRSNPKRIHAQVNMREDPVLMLWQRKLLDNAQARAATRFRHLWERMGGAGARAIDFRKEAVDGGRSRDPVDITQIEAGGELERARALLGEHGYRLVGYICGQGYSIHDLASTRRERDTATDMLRLHLDQLAEMWSLRTTSLPSNKMRK